MFPICLFVEAKLQGSKIGLPEFRSAVAVVEDLNQNYSPVSSGITAVHTSVLVSLRAVLGAQSSVSRASATTSSGDIARPCSQASANA